MKTLIGISPTVILWIDIARLFYWHEDLNGPWKEVICLSDLSKLFNDSMTDIQARTVYFENVGGMTGEDRKRLNEEYRKVSKVITKREIERANDGWMCS
jgi:hypothetical protein